MNTRLQNFLNAENLTQSQFADSIGVARASVSHILSGRNKPGFDFIESLARKYPSLNLEWLITGKGKMYDSPKELDLFTGVNSITEQENKIEESEQNPQPLTAQQSPSPSQHQSEYQQSQPQQQAQIQLEPQVQPQLQAQIQLEPQVQTQQQAVIHQQPQQKTQQNQLPSDEKKSISQIIIFFDDGTFSKVY